jgi:hypothetical protein
VLQAENFHQNSNSKKKKIKKMMRNGQLQENLALDRKGKC